MAKHADRWAVERALRWMRPCFEAVDHEREFARKLEDGLTDESATALTALTDVFRKCGAWPIVRGVFALRDGDDSGWDQIHTGIRRAMLDFLACSQQHDAVGGHWHARIDLPFVWGSTWSLCNAMLYAIATGEDEAAVMIGDRLVRQVSSPDPGLFRGRFDDSPYESFALMLYCRWRGSRADAVERFLTEPKRFKLLHSDDHRAVIRSWDEPEAFDRAVEGMVRPRSRWSGAEDEPWEKFPYGVVPVEFLALRRVRLSLGLSFQMPDHPMLRTPWASPPEGLDRSPRDELWRRVVARCRHMMPSLALPANW